FRPRPDQRVEGNALLLGLLPSAAAEVTRLAFLRFAILTGLLTSAATRAAELPPEHVEFFETKIRPLLVEHCYKCHSTESGKSKGGLQLDTRDALRKGGGTGPALVAGEPGKSLLIEAVRYQSDDLQMPPPDEGGKLSTEKIAALEQWIRLGAPDPRDTVAKPSPVDMAAARRHWAFQPVVRPAAPKVKNARWVQTPVDAFVLAKLEAKNLPPSPPADARTLLRRLTYDLTGLPPTPEEVDAFVADRSPDAYARAVDRLLASPRYGERWGRFWLDVARYADTKGYLAGNEERRYAFSHTYRDWVIRAFNDDKPFDRFLVEQLAGDRVATDADKSPLAALGFLTLGRRFLNNPNDIIDDRIDVTTRGLMGLTVGCARCHDHKFDPVPMADYYGLHGVFASSDEPKEKPLLAPLADTPAYQTFRNKQAGIERRIVEREHSEVEKVLSAAREKTGDYLLGAHDAGRLPAGEKLELFAGPRKLNVDILKRWQAFAPERARQHDPVLAPWFALAALPADGFAPKAAELAARWKENADTEKPLHPLIAAAFATAPASLKEAAAIYDRVIARVEKNWQDEVAKAEKNKSTPPLALAGADDESLRQWLHAEGAPPNLPFDTAAVMLRRQLNDKTSGLRREIEALNWTEPGAPLRAMAMVDKPAPANTRIFLRGNPANRGPEAPRQFLEVLAGGSRQPFRDGSGRLELARAIASPDNPLTARVFVNRVWGWHFGAPLVRTTSDFGLRTEPPVQRELLDWLAASFVEGGWSLKQLHRAIVLSATYRQSSDARAELATLDPDNQLLHRANRRRLELEAMRDTLLAAAGTLDLTPGGFSVDLTTEPFTRRRTIYGFIDRQNLPGVFRVFDYPNPDASSPGRFATTVPQQALFMMNSPFVQEQARQVMKRPEFIADATEDNKIRTLYRAIFQRAPDKTELKLAKDFLTLAVTPLPVEPPAPPTAEPTDAMAKKGKKKAAEIKKVPAIQLTRWEELAQVLLLSNEVAFVD
ncbi:MAG: PSD1 domain-containing protein, partial [Verrucomicrobia bacterium]|nr:PSD1 domain-containing protein [Verrucomicrobiota bacterium]